MSDEKSDYTTWARARGEIERVVLYDSAERDGQALRVALPVLLAQIHAVETALARAGIARTDAPIGERVEMLASRTAYWQGQWDALHEKGRAAYAEIERLFMAAANHSDDDARARSQAFAEVLDVIDGKPVDPSRRIKDIEARAAQKART